MKKLYIALVIILVATVIHFGKREEEELVLWETTPTEDKLIISDEK